jgi:predicted aspartyl protease
MPKPIYNVFKVEYNGIARELSSEVAIADPLSGKRLTLKRVIWDTGATNCVLNHGVADKLGLQPTGQMQVMTANGQAIASTFLINIILPPLNAEKQVRIIDINAAEGDLGPDTDMLIGMDVISIGDFAVENDGGKTCYSFCLPPFDNKYGMIEKADKLNTRNAKFNAKQSGKLLKG